MANTDESSENRRVEKNILLRQMIDALKMARDEKLRTAKFKKEEKEFHQRLKQKTDARPKMTINHEALRMERAIIRSSHSQSRSRSRHDQVRNNFNVDEKAGSQYSSDNAVEQSIRESAYIHLEKSVQDSRRGDGFDDLPEITPQCLYGDKKKSDQSFFEKEMKHVSINAGASEYSMNIQMHEEYVNEYEENALIKKPEIVKHGNAKKVAMQVRGSITEQAAEKEADDSMPISPVRSLVAISEKYLPEEDEMVDLAEHIPMQRLRPKSSTVPRGGATAQEVEQEENLYGLNPIQKEKIAINTNHSSHKSIGKTTNATNKNGRYDSKRSKGSRRSSIHKTNSHKSNRSKAKQTAPQTAEYTNNRVNNSNSKITLNESLRLTDKTENATSVPGSRTVVTQNIATSNQIGEDSMDDMLSTNRMNDTSVEIKINDNSIGQSNSQVSLFAQQNRAQQLLRKNHSNQNIIVQQQHLRSPVKLDTVDLAIAQEQRSPQSVVNYNKHVVNQYLPPRGLNTYKKNDLKPSKQTQEQLSFLQRRQEHENQMMQKARLAAFNQQHAQMRGGKVMFRDHSRASVQTSPAKMFARSSMEGQKRLPSDLQTRSMRQLHKIQALQQNLICGEVPQEETLTDRPVLRTVDEALKSGQNVSLLLAGQTKRQQGIIKKNLRLSSAAPNQQNFYQRSYGLKNSQSRESTDHMGDWPLTNDQNRVSLQNYRRDIEVNNGRISSDLLQTNLGFIGLNKERTFNEAHSMMTKNSSTKNLTMQVVPTAVQQNTEKQKRRANNNHLLSQAGASINLTIKHRKRKQTNSILTASSTQQIVPRMNTPNISTKVTNMQKTAVHLRSEVVYVNNKMSGAIKFAGLANQKLQAQRGLKNPDEELYLKFLKFKSKNLNQT